MSENVKPSQQNQLKNLQYLSIDETTYATDADQFGIIISVIFPNFDIFEDFLCFTPMKGTTLDSRKYS